MAREVEKFGLGGKKILLWGHLGPIFFALKLSWVNLFNPKLCEFIHVNILAKSAVLLYVKIAENALNLGFRLPTAG